MDERVSTVYEGQVFEFCCKPCIKKFHKNPSKYQAMLAAGKSS
jgi:YHS domain-containing protein